jgi:hypothetical protein
MEMADLIAFKTSTLTAIGFQRNRVWARRPRPRSWSILD